MIFLGIGSNLSSSFGDRFKNIDLAISFLEGYKVNIIKKSSLYESFSYPNKSNPKFINSVIAVETKLSPIDLMSVLISVEEKLERKRSYKNEPRTCDIDIIDFNSQIIDFEYKNKSKYTFNTIKFLKEKYPNYNINMILGVDQFNEIDSWKSSDYVLNSVNLFVISYF